jgi:hypothetical protein
MYVSTSLGTAVSTPGFQVAATVRKYGSGGALEGAAREGPYTVRPGRGLRRCGPGGVLEGAAQEGPQNVWPRRGLRKGSPRGALEGVARAREGP